MREVINKGRSRNPNRLIDLRAEALSPPKANKASDLDRILTDWRRRGINGVGMRSHKNSRCGVSALQEMPVQNEAVHASRSGGGRRRGRKETPNVGEIPRPI